MEKPPLRLSNIPYGPHPRNTLDLWTIEGESPTPLLVWIHGGGFWCGDKGGVRPNLVNSVLGAGIAMASINYRLSQQAPFPASMVDGARAIQFLRHYAKGLNIDPERVAAGGGSAGGGISLWCGFHEDLADPSSDELIARQSTRPNCMVCIDTQSSYDPNFIRTIITGAAGEHGALQMLFRVPVEKTETPEARKIFAEGSAMEHITADAPPVLTFYTRRNIPPTSDMDPDYGIHHPRFGEVLKEKLDSLGVECVLQMRDDYPDASEEEIREIFDREAVAFMKRQFHIE